jgi:hypothetical protein
MASEAPAKPSCSRPEQIAALEIGESYSISRRFGFDKAKTGDLSDGMQAMRDTMQAAAARAKFKTGAEYVIEGGHFWTRGLDVMATVVVTRMR